MKEQELIDLCTERLKESVRMFGTYPLFDKGAFEVMDIPPLGKALMELEPAQAARVIEALNERVKETGDNTFEPLCEALCYYAAEESSDDWAEAFLSSDIVSKYY